MIAAALSFVAGLVVAGLVADVVLAVRIYWIFPAQRKR